MVVVLVLVGVLALCCLILVCRASTEYDAFMKAVPGMKRKARETLPRLLRSTVDYRPYG